MSDALSATFAALADPTRRAILARLTRGEATVTELARPFAMSLPTVSRHLQVLERAGLVVKSRDAQWRRCRLDTTPLRELDAWLVEYRRFFEGRFDLLERHLRTLTETQPDQHEPDQHETDQHQTDQHQTDEHQTGQHEKE
jgi:DNA-binding transcriptional ArsR family regulator